MTLYTLDDILKEKPLNNNKHDTLIKNIMNSVGNVNNIRHMYASADYNYTTNKGKHLVSDIDLLQMQIDISIAGLYSDWREVPDNLYNLLVWEMKSRDTKTAYHKAKKQLKKHETLLSGLGVPKSFIQSFYCFGISKGGSFGWRYERLGGD